MLVLLKVENECLVGRDKIRAGGGVKQRGKNSRAAEQQDQRKEALSHER